MVGVGTEAVDLDSYKYSFCSFLGRDSDSWGLSYYGRAQHKGNFLPINGARFGQGSIIGCHLDMWHGTLSFYKNRRPLGKFFYVHMLFSLDLVYRYAYSANDI